MINMFEQEHPDRIRRANVIILQIPKAHTEALVPGKEEYEIVGGYASHGWAVSQSEHNQGDETCFLFNLTQNLRFKAVRGRAPYQVTESATDQKNSRRLLFGRSGALIIENDFKKVSSKIGDQSSKEAQFVFGDEIMQKNKVDSIIPGKQQFEQPHRVEVWTIDIPEN